jgi:hypothetical protein
LISSDFIRNVNEKMENHCVNNESNVQTMRQFQAGTKEHSANLQSIEIGDKFTYDAPDTPGNIHNLRLSLISVNYVDTNTFENKCLIEFFSSFF